MAGFSSAIAAYNTAANIGGYGGVGQSGYGNGAAEVNGVGFSNIIGNTLRDTASAIGAAENTVAKSLVKQADITDVVTAITNAELTLRTVMEVRDKLIAAHQEIMRMPI